MGGGDISAIVDNTERENKKKIKISYFNFLYYSKKKS